MKKLLLFSALLLASLGANAQAIVKKGLTAAPIALPTTDTLTRELRLELNATDHRRSGIFGKRKDKGDQQYSVSPRGIRQMIQDSNQVLRQTLRLGLADSLQVVRDKQPAVLLVDHGGGPGKTGAQNKAAFFKAKARAALLGVKVIQYPAGYLVSDPIDLVGGAGTDSIIIQGMGKGRTYLFMSSVIGDALFNLIQTKAVTIRDMTLDGRYAGTNASGVVRINGSGNLVENVEIRKGKSFSCTVSGRYSNGVGWVYTLSDRNKVRGVTISGQDFYHTTGGNAALFAADSAANTEFEYCTLIDNFLGETGDYIGSDHAVYTVIRNVTAIRTGATRSPGAALHLEGEEPYNNMHVTVENFQAVNFTIGISISQNSRLKMTGHNQIRSCRQAIVAYSEYAPDIENVDIIDCGAADLAASITEGVVQNAKSGRYTRLRFFNTNANLAFANYNGDPAGSVGEPVDLINCEFDRKVQASSTNVGSYSVNLTRCLFTNTSLEWYNNIGLRLVATDCYFLNSVAVGARAAYVRFRGGTMTGTNAQTAITLNLDNHNFRIEGMRIEGFNSLGDPAKMTIGPAMSQQGLTTPFTTYEDALTTSLAGKLNLTGGTLSGTLTINTAAGIGTAIGDRLRINPVASLQGYAANHGYGIMALSRTVTDNSSTVGTTNPFGAAHGLGQITLGSTNAVTVSDAMTLFLADGPLAGTNTTISRRWSLWNAGKTYLGGGANSATDIYITDATKGYILRKPDNSGCYRMTIDNNGDWVKTAITCP